jgi:hypothetical protein
MEGNKILLYFNIVYIVQHMSGTAELVKHNDAIMSIKPDG